MPEDERAVHSRRRGDALGTATATKQSTTSLPAEHSRKRFLRSARLRGAIEFLTSIPLGTGGGPSPVDVVAGRLAASSGAASAMVTQRNAAAATVMECGGAVVLRGRPFRHVTSRGHRESRQFREALLRDGVLDGRVVFSRNKDYPSLLFSLIKYDATAETEFRRERQAAAAGLLLAAAAQDESLPTWMRWKGRSYAPLLQPEWCGSAATAAAGDGGVLNVPAAESGGAPTFSLLSYRPTGLDDPAIDLEKARFRYSREGYSVSILAFRNERSQKDDINAKFARTHGWIPATDRA